VYLSVKVTCKMNTMIRQFYKARTVACWVLKCYSTKGCKLKMQQNLLHISVVLNLLKADVQFPPPKSFMKTHLSMTVQALVVAIPSLIPLNSISITHFFFIHQNLSIFPSHFNSPYNFLSNLPLQLLIPSSLLPLPKSLLFSSSNPYFHPSELNRIPSIPISFQSPFSSNHHFSPNIPSAHPAPPTPFPNLPHLHPQIPLSLLHHESK